MAKAKLLLNNIRAPIEKILIRTKMALKIFVGFRDAQPNLQKWGRYCHYKPRFM
ncbi:MAG: hypothetical protein RLZZ338_4202 [Cyanobacteriota bacterium]|jgi:hypothetical protein